MFPFRFPNPKPRDIFDPIYIVSEYYIDRKVFGFHFLTHRHIQTIHKQEGIKRFSGTVLPSLGRFDYPVGNRQYDIVGYFKTIKYPPRYLRQPSSSCLLHTWKGLYPQSRFHPENILGLPAVQRKRPCPAGLQPGYTRKWISRFYCCNHCGGFCTFMAVVVGFIPKVGIYFPLDNASSIGPKISFDCLLHVFYIFTAILFKDCLCDCNGFWVSFLFSRHKCCTHNSFIRFRIPHFIQKIKCVSFVTGNLHTLFYPLQSLQIRAKPSLSLLINVPYCLQHYPKVQSPL